MLKNENELDLAVWHCLSDELYDRWLNYFASQTLRCKIDVASQTMNNECVTKCDAIPLNLCLDYDSCQLNTFCCLV